MNLKGAAVFTNGTLVNGGTIAVTNAGNEHDNEDVTNTASITVAAGADLVIDNAGTLNNSVSITISGTAQIHNDHATPTRPASDHAGATLTLDQNSSVANN